MPTPAKTLLVRTKKIKSSPFTLADDIHQRTKCHLKTTFSLISERQCQCCENNSPKACSFLTLLFFSSFFPSSLPFFPYFPFLLFRLSDRILPNLLCVLSPFVNIPEYDAPAFSTSASNFFNASEAFCTASFNSV